MEIISEKKDRKLILQLFGRLDTYTAPKLSEWIDKGTDDIFYLQIDMQNLEYLSSAGLRVLLAAQKKMKTVKGTLLVTGVNEEVMEVFKITGFNTFLDIRQALGEGQVLRCQI